MPDEPLPFDKPSEPAADAEAANLKRKARVKDLIDQTRESLIPKPDEDESSVTPDVAPDPSVYEATIGPGNRKMSYAEARRRANLLRIQEARAALHAAQSQQAPPPAPKPGSTPPAPPPPFPPARPSQP